MNWQGRRMFVCRHLGLTLVVMESPTGGWAWEVSGPAGSEDVMHRCLRPLSSLALAKNAAVVAASRAVRIAA